MVKFQIIIFELRRGAKKNLSVWVVKFSPCHNSSRLGVEERNDFLVPRAQVPDSLGKLAGDKRFQDLKVMTQDCTEKTNSREVQHSELMNT